MNHIYRVLWNAVSSTWTAVAEIARGAGKGSTTITRRRNLAAFGVMVMIPPFALAQVASVVVAPGSSLNAYVAPNGVTVVNINQANAAGLSHNQYNSFNVNSNGLILNNTTSAQKIAWQSQLAGQVIANFNTTSTARVILNEVISNNRSTLAGFTEVLGGKADVVLANPYGITCSGCGFINTDRVTLTSGNPFLAADGGLGGFSVGQGDILITGTGMNATAQQILDLVTRAVRIEAPINAQDLNIVAGANRWSYDSRTVTGTATTTGSSPAYSVDTAVLGGMYANRIRMTSTEAGVGVRMLGDAAASAGEFTLNAAGKVELQNHISGSTDVRVSTTQTGADALALIDASLTSTGKTTLAATGGVFMSGSALVAGTDLSVSAASLIDAKSASSIANNNLRHAGNALSLEVTNTASVGATEWGAVGAWTGNFGNLVTTGATKLYTSGGTLIASADKGDLAIGLAALQSAGNMALTSAGKISTATGGALQSLGGNMALTASNGIDNAGNITADNGAVRVQADGALVNSGTVNASGALDIADHLGNGTLNSVSNTGKLLAGSTLALHATSVDNSATAWIQAGTSSTVDVGTLNNHGAWLLSQQANAADVVTVTGALVNTGTLQSHGNASITSESIDNQLALLAGGNLTASTASNFVNRGSATTQAGNTLTVSAGGKINNAVAGLLRGGDVSLRSAQNMDNAGIVSAETGSATLRTNGALTNSGAVQAAQTLDIGDFNGSSSESVANTGYMGAGTTLILKAAAITNATGGSDPRNGRIQATTGSTVNAASIDNAGTWVLAQQGGNDSQVTLTGTLLNASAGTLQAGTQGGSENVTYNVAKIDNQGKLFATGNLQANVSATDGFTNQGTAQAGGTLGIAGAGTTLTNKTAGKLIGNGLNIAVTNIDNSGVVQGGGSAATNVAATGTLTNRAGAVIAAATDAPGNGTGVVSGGTIANAGTLQSSGGITVAVGTGGLTSSGDILSNGDLRIAALSGNNYTASIGGTLQSAKLLSVQGAGSTLELTGGQLDASGNPLNLASGATVNIGVGTLTLSKTSGLSSAGQMDVTNNTLTLEGDTVRTARLMGAVGGTGTANITVFNDLSNDGLIFSGHDLVVKAPNINNNSNGALVALNDLSIQAKGGYLNLDATTPEPTAGNLVNAGSVYAGNNLTAKVNGTLTNTSTINAGNKISLLANTLINNRDIVSDGDIDIIATTLRNEVVGGDTREWVYGTRTTVQVGGRYDDNPTAGNLDEAEDFRSTWTDQQQYRNGQVPTYSPQILATKNTRLIFTTGSNLGGAIYGGLSIIMQGFSVDPNQVSSNAFGIFDDLDHFFQMTGDRFTNDNLALNKNDYTRNYTQTRKWRSQGPDKFYDWSECNSNTGTYDQICHYDSKNNNQTFVPTSVNALKSGIYTSSLTGNGFALYNNGSTTALPNPATAVAAPAPDVVKPTAGGSNPRDAAPRQVTTAAPVSNVLPSISFTASNVVLGVSGTSFGGINLPLPTSPNGLFVIVRTPGARYLVESNPLYQVGSSTMGSDYLSKLLKYNPDQIGMRLGDASYEAYLVKQQLVAQTGNVILAQYANAATQMQGLMESAATEAKSLGLQYGKALTPQQQAALQGDIVWMVQTVIGGQTVLAPVVYLAQSTKNNIASGAVISAKDANLSLTSLTNTGGTIVGGKSLVIASAGDISNLSGIIKGGDLSLSSTDGSIINKTVSTGSGGDKFFSTTIGSTATIESTGALSLDAKKDITNLGANVVAGTDATLKAGGNVTFDTIEDKNTKSNVTVFKADGGKGLTQTTTTTVTQVKSGLKVGGNLSADAGKDITLAGTDVKVGGNANLKAGDNLNIVARENTTTTSSKSEAKGFGMNNSVYGKTTVKSDSESVRNVGSTLQVSGDASLTAKNDVTVQGSNIDVTGSGSINATNVNVLAGRNYDETTTKTTKTGVLQVSAGGKGSASAKAKADANSNKSKSGVSAGAEASASAQAAGTGAAGLAFSAKTTIEEKTTDLKYVGSTLNFGKDLAVNAAKEVNLQGSTINAEGNATVNAKNVNLLAAEDKKTSNTTTTKTSIGLMASAKAEVGVGAQAGAGASASYGGPNANASASAKAGADAEVHLDFGQRSKTTSRQLDTTNQGSAINSGGNLTVNASESLNLTGSTMASGGDMTLNAKDMTFAAAVDRSETESSSNLTTAGLYASGSASANAQGSATAGFGAQAGASATASATGSVGIYAANSQTRNLDGSTQAVTSGLSSGGNMTRNAANSITDVGTQINVVGDLNQSAQTIVSKAAENTTYSTASSNSNSAKLGVYAEAGATAAASGSVGPGSKKPGGVETSRGAGVKANFQHEDETSKSNTSSAVVSNITVGGSVNSRSKGTTSLEGTNITADKNVSLTASALDYTAAKDTSSSSGKSNSADVTASFDIQNRTGTGSLDYSHNKKSDSSSTAVVGGISAGGNLKVATTGDTRFVGTNVAAGGDTNVAAGGKVNFDAAKNTTGSSNTDVSVGVSVTVGAKEGSGSGSVAVTKSSSSGDQDVAGSVSSGGKLSITSGSDATFTGTNIASGGDATVAAGGNLTFKAAHDIQSSSSVGVEAAGSGGKGQEGKGTKVAGATAAEMKDKKQGEASLGVAVDVKDSNQATGSTITSGGKLQLSSGKDTNLEGVKGSAADGIGVTAGGAVNLTSAKSTSSSTSVGVTAAGSGVSTKPEKTKPSTTPSTTPVTKLSTPPSVAPPPTPTPKLIRPVPVPPGVRAPSVPPSFAPPPTPKPVHPLPPGVTATPKIPSVAPPMPKVPTPPVQPATQPENTKKGSGVATIDVNLDSKTTTTATTLDGGLGGVTVTSGANNPATQKTTIQASVPLPANMPANKPLMARTADGKPLPTWLKFDSSTGKFSGSPPADFKGSVKVDVKVPQADGSTKTVQMNFAGGGN